MKSGRSGFGESAASEAIGAVMLISVVVLAVAIIGVVLTSQGTPEKLPAVSAVISTSDGKIFVYHDGGDSLTSGELLILVDGQERTFTKGGSPGPWTWSIGDTLSYDMSPDTPGSVRVVYEPGSYTIAFANFAAMGSAPVPTTTQPPTPVIPPVAEFSGTPTSGTAPLTVAFTDLSLNSPTSWSWNFGDMGTSATRNPTHIFTSAGTYTVSLTATNAGGSDTEIKTAYISVSSPGPVVTGISPASGSTTGGTTVTVTGTGFTGAHYVLFGTTANATGAMTVVSDTEITVTSPPGSAGTVHVTVTTSYGTSATSSADEFTYVVPTYMVVTFTDVGTTSWTAPAGVTSVEYLVVGGGGGGGGTSIYITAYGGGGGGAGGFRTGSGYTVIPGNTYTVTVGAGGSGGATGPNSGSAGSNSRFDAIVAAGGGYGAGGDGNTWGGDGGSGGGGVANGHGGDGTSGQGYDGGDGYRQHYLGGGGGGSGEAGSDAIAGSSGDGGDGAASSISGSSVTYAGGGGGGSGYYVSSGADGGSGGGGSGGASPANDGEDATGYGSGGGGGTSAASGGGATAGGNGSSGIVIIRYLSP